MNSLRQVGDRLLPLILAILLITSLRSGGDLPLVPYSTHLYLAASLIVPFIYIVLLSFFDDIKIYEEYYLFLSIILIILFLSIISGLMSKYPEEIIFRSISVMGSLICIFYLIYFSYDPILLFKRIAITLIIFTLIICLLAIIIFIFGDVSIYNGRQVQSVKFGPFLISQNVFGIYPLLRVSSLLGNPNSLAVIIFISMALTLYLRKKLGVFFKFIVLVNFVAVALTVSRAGIVSSILIFFLYYMIMSVNIVKYIYKTSFIFILCAAGLFLSPIGSLISINPDRFSAGSSERVQVWKLLLDRIEDNPIVGVGFGVSYEEILESSGLELAAHNFHLQTISEIGLIGYSIILFLTTYTIYLGIRICRRNPTEESAKAVGASVSVLIVFLLHGMFEGYLLRVGYETFVYGCLVSFILTIHRHNLVKSRNVSMVNA